MNLLGYALTSVIVVALWSRSLQHELGEIAAEMVSAYRKRIKELP